MKKTLYRIILKKTNDSHRDALTGYLMDEFKFSKNKAVQVITSSPTVLFDTPHKEKIKTVSKTLFNMDTQITIQRLVKDEGLPFFIDHIQLKWISKLLNMTMRAGVETALVSVLVEPVNPEGFTIPLIGRDEDIEKGFRESDSLYIVSNNQLLFLGFTTDKTGLPKLTSKIVKSVEKIVGKDPTILFGGAIFPEDGYSFYKLLTKAQSRQSPYAADESVIKTTDNKPVKPQIISQRRPVTDLDLCITCFTNARGLFFNKMIRMDREILWYFLNKLPLAQKEQFIQRLPYNSFLVKFLSEKTEHAVPAKKLVTAEQHLKKFALKMQFENNLTTRKKNQNSIAGKLNHIESISTLPSVAMQVYNAALDPETNMDNIQEIIQVDQVLTLKLLKLVNSAFYGLTQKVNSVKEAVIILGMDEIINMAFGLSISASFKSKTLPDQVNPNELWKHAVGSAVIGRHICRNLENINSQQVFTSCILHDFGKLFLIESFSEKYIKIIELSKKTGIPIYDLEEEFFGDNHGAMGGKMAKKWNLPDSLVQAISFHHHPSESEGYSELAAITGFADFLCNFAMAPSTEDDLPKSVIPSLLQDHVTILQTVFQGFTPQLVDDMLVESRDFLKQSQDIFSILMSG